MLHVHRSESANTLVTALAGLLRDPAPGADPFAPDVLAVGARGTERWIAQRLSHHLGAGDPAAGGGDDGICARVDTSSPAHLLDGVLAAALERTRPGTGDAVERWAPSSLTWDVLEVLDEIAPADGGPAPDGRPEFALLRHHLRHHPGDDGPGGPGGPGTPPVRRTAAAARVAGLFARYGAARPQLLADWAAGRDDAPGAPLPADLRWQPEVFRAVRERVGLPAPAELLDDACAALRTDPALSDLGPRLAVFLVTRLATSRLRVLSALAEHREVHLLLQHPSPALWDATAAALRTDPGPRRAAWAAHAPGRHPLLRSMARDVRELQVRLAHAAPGHTDVHHPAPEPAPTLLGTLQAALARDAEPAPGPDPGDRSVQVHACHGRARQVEVLREVVLGLLDADPTLQPRDVLVACPDVETFAPLVSAAFATDSHPGGGLRVQVADRSALRTNPLLGLAVRLLGLAQSRAGATEVLDLAAAAPVRRRFDLDDEDLEQLREWTVAAGVHWGLSARHRGAWQLGSLDQGTWRAGLDRLLVGVAVGGAVEDDLVGRTGEDGLLGAVVPLADVESSRIDLAGRFAELLDRLDAAVTRLQGRHGVAAWCDTLLDAVLDLADTAPEDAWQVAQLRRELGVVAHDAARAGTARVGLTDVAATISERFAAHPQRANFRTGALTVCTPAPVRAVPHRVVCLLGMDDGAFPRAGGPDADDVLARDPHVGDRDPRGEDRQVLLDLVRSARDALVVTYSGRDVRTGAVLPPAVPVGEVLDALEAAHPGVRARIEVHHPLQPTDRRNFTPGALGTDGPFSHDGTAFSGADAGHREPAPVPPFLPAALPPAPAADLDLDTLVQFLQHPARGFLRQRLDVASATREEEPDDALPVQLDALQKWAVGDRALAARLRGVAAPEVVRLEGARGGLPPGPLGVAVLREVGPVVDAIAGVAAEFDTAPPRSVDVELDLDVPGVGQLRLTGNVRGVRPVRGGGRATGEVAVTTVYSRIKGKQTLRAWVELLALSAAHPGTEFRTVLVGRGDRGSTGLLTLGPVRSDAARDLLVDLLELRAVGLRFPLPLPVDTAAAWAQEAWRGRAPDACLRAARRAWTSDFSFDKEDRQEENVTVWGAERPVEHLVRWEPPTTLPPGVPTTFEGLVRRVWEPLLGVQRMDER
ncbi:exodeoxyribonuclease V subunit gamma [Kineococcus radiotolerans]|uniref:RecBCD enzyme subunit RecC n=1 Tax=Kineococcus radiotolerans (strain ATCC BAA-149 / DSM 14245 / SRS30216) TaxID=266940 RepID=A6W6P1_KINRD|nr:exodeoxyribonuclease V subunit gamma [Kineococcus radiotolerans]ABS02480.1 exodeoxyribonuclease V, gamma subunit [Kineococcus radiotolerans SRS30216 = ATCC BAA-149]